MLPFFPNPELDETVFSLISRFSARFLFPETDIIKLILGRCNNHSLLATIPGNIAHLSNSMPLSHPWNNPEEIIVNHTNLNYFLYFNKGYTLNDWTNRIINDKTPMKYEMALGLRAYKCSSKPKNLQFCHLCMVDELADKGFCIFRREHQLPAVYYCWKHQVLLSVGCQHCGLYPIKGKPLIMSGKCNCTHGITPLPVKENITNPEPLIWLTKESKKLLNIPKQPINYDINEDLKKQALLNGLGRGSQLNHRSVACAIEERFGKENLQLLNLPAFSENKPSAWIQRLLGKPGSEIKNKPTIYYLLYIGAIFDSVQDFEIASSSSNNYPPSASIPITPTPSKWQVDLPKFLSQPGSLTGFAIKYNISVYQVISELKLKKICFPLTQRAIKRIGESTLKNVRLSLINGVQKKDIMKKFNIGEWTLTLIELDDLSLLEKHRESVKKNIISKHRNALLEYLNKNPNAGRTDIFEDLPGCYDFLISLDKDWFHSKIPQIKVRSNCLPRTKRVNWENLDHNSSILIKSFVGELLSTTKRPVRVSKSLLLSEANIFDQFNKYPQRFPKVSAVLEDSVESHDKYIERKLKWGVLQLINKEDEISANKLRRIVGMPVKVLHTKRVFIKKTMLELNVKAHHRSFFA